MQRASRPTGVGRRGALAAVGLAAAAVAVLGQPTEPAVAHDLRPDDPKYKFDRYEAVVNNPKLKVRVVFQWPNIANPIIFGNVGNLLNGFQFSYNVPPDQIQVVVQAYASSNLAMYTHDAIAKYRLGELLGVKDPASGELVTRNIWYHSKLSEASAPADRASPYYGDTSIEGLQRRGVLFSIWHQTIHGHAGLAWQKGFNPDGLTAQQIADELDQNLIPDGNLIPAAVGEIVRLQTKGYGLVVNH